MFNDGVKFLKVLNILISPVPNFYILKQSCFSLPKYE